MQKAVMIFVGSTALMVSLGALNAAAQLRAEAGVLTCRLGPNVGRIITARPRMRCQFVKSDGRTENYLGTITRFGLDLDITVGGVMKWAVLANTGITDRGVLAGHYVVANSDISPGVGIGANALIGGSRRSTVLQPLSLTGQVGINLAAGVAGLLLRYGGG